MSKYRKKPVVIEAFQYMGNHEQEDDPSWLKKAIEEDKIGFEYGQMIIDTQEDALLATKGDYIIKGPEGEIYPCNADVFEMTYEKVNDYMKLFEATNGYEGNSYVRILVIAKNEHEAIELAKSEFKKKVVENPKCYDENYYKEISVKCLCSQLNADWTGCIED